MGDRDGHNCHRRMAARREKLRTIASGTLGAIENGAFTQDNRTYAIPGIIETCLYSPHDLGSWNLATARSRAGTTTTTEIGFLNASTLEAAALLHETRSPTSPRIGILNFASATKPGGGFMNGAQAQEESLARSSTIYPSLISEEAKPFYATHKHDNRGCYYTHHIIWSSGVSVFRDDEGRWLEPYQVDMVTCPAVNAGVVRRRAIDPAYEEARIETVMRERMSRILFVFETRGVSRLVLGSFGTGVFGNKVAMVARLWAELLAKRGSRFETSFEQVVFGIIDQKTLDEFKTAFEQH